MEHVSGIEQIGAILQDRRRHDAMQCDNNENLPQTHETFESPITLEWVKMLGGIYFRTICRNGIPLPEPTRYLLSHVYPGIESKQTAQTYANWLLPFFKWLDWRKIELTDIRAIDLLRYRRDLLMERKPGGNDNSNLKPTIRLLRNGANSAGTTLHHVTSIARRFTIWAMEPDDAQALIRRGGPKKSIRPRVLLRGITIEDMDTIAKGSVVSRKRRDLQRHLSLTQLDNCRIWIMKSYSYNPQLQVRNRAIFELLWDGALRKGALLAVRTHHIDFMEGTVLVPFVEEDYRQAWYRKRSNERAIKTHEYIATISPETVQWLVRYRDEVRLYEGTWPNHDIFFCKYNPGDDDHGQALSVDGLDWLFTVMSKSVAEGGVGFRVTPHMLRHTWATLALKDSVPIDVVQRQLGHVLITSTEEYNHVMPEETRDTIRAWRREHLHYFGKVLI